jgi:hypothetical protein
LTSTEFISEDDTIIIKDVASQLPILMSFGKAHYLGEAYVDGGDLVLIDKYVLFPRFNAMHIISPQSLVDQEVDLYPQSQAVENEKNVTYNYTINDKV